MEGDGADHQGPTTLLVGAPLKSEKVLEAAISLKKEVLKDQRQMAGGRAIFKFLGKKLGTRTHAFNLEFVWDLNVKINDIEVLSSKLCKGTYDRQEAEGLAFTVITVLRQKAGRSYGNERIWTTLAMVEQVLQLLLMKQRPCHSSQLSLAS
ncbi:hypothetical protein HPP92_025557 [Vanilla planifolia]|uniref:Uncharacterized protein n=1 Tax=Vanilla planifolia TaxID=51239 RepID=A0A835UAL5_VANPL|nr:hypothetical protein HPP92_025557 [Vanilla planifolia]